MKKYKSTLILSLAFTLAFSQNKDVNTVRTQFPEIYRSIESSADEQWNFSPKAKAEVIQGQAKAFLKIVAMGDLSNKDLADAIVKNSLPNTRDQNITILRNSNNINPFSRLQCDWYKVESDYRKKKESNSPISTEHYTPPTLAKEYDQPSQKDNIDSTPVEVIIIEDSYYPNDVEPINNFEQTEPTYNEEYNTSKNRSQGKKTPQNNVNSGETNKINTPAKPKYINDYDGRIEDDQATQDMNSVFIEEYNTPNNTGGNNIQKTNTPQSKTKNKDVPPSKPVSNNGSSSKAYNKPSQNVNQNQTSEPKSQTNEVPQDSNKNYIKKEAKSADNVSEETVIWF